MVQPVIMTKRGRPANGSSYDRTKQSLCTYLDPEEMGMVAMLQEKLATKYFRPSKSHILRIGLKELYERNK